MRTSLRELDQIIVALGRLRGWEPDWRLMAPSDGTVEVDETFLRTAPDGSSFSRSTSWRKSGEQEQGRTVYPGNGWSDWKFDAGTYSQRWERGPWKVVPTGTPRSRVSEPPGWALLNEWGVEPGTMTRKSGGRIVFRLPRRDRAGAMEFEARDGAWQVEEIRMYGMAEQLVWLEIRTFTRQGGWLLLSLRERRYYDPPGEVEVERCAWRIASDAVVSRSIEAVQDR